jgi:Phosphoesterase family.
VNTIQSVFMPHSPKITDKTLLLPAQDMPTIGDRLSDKGVSWAWYAGGWDDAVAGHGDKLFQYHHAPSPISPNTATARPRGRSI